ncbi:hypothetical protein BGX33_009645 [Mortierella sp. NVP41]|nr:hypothetical protein BGX33_009645 [Mortierella sp. NVP41]
MPTSRTSLSVSSSLSEWHQAAYKPPPSNPAPLPALVPVPTSAVPVYRQQRNGTKHQKSRPASEVGDGTTITMTFPSRPNSFASSYQPIMLSRKNSQRSSQQQQRQLLDPGTLKAHNNNNSQQYEKESNAAFERICTLLTHLITDASTAVNTAESTSSSTSKDLAAAGAAVTPIVIPRYVPFVCSDTESSSEGEVSDTEDGGHGHRHGQGEDAALTLETAIERSECIFDEEEAAAQPFPESPRDQIRRRIDNSRKKRWTRTRSGSFVTNPSKRTSLFLELQNLHLDLEGGEQHPATLVHGVQPCIDSERGQHQHQKEAETTNDGVLSPDIHAHRILDTRLHSPTTPSKSLDFELFDSELGSPVTLTPRRRASFPPRRTDSIQIQRAEELQRMIQRVDAELDRTVETIDGLTKDLVAVATHQNWMKAHLERTLGLQSPLSLAGFIQQDDVPSPTMGMAAEAGAEGGAAQEGLASPRGRLEQMEGIIGATKALLSSKEFVNYYQVLERVKAMGQEDNDNYHHHRHDYDRRGDTIFGTRPDDDDAGNKQQRLSGSSYTLTNDSFRHSASSTLSLETRFGSFSDFKEGGLLTSRSTSSSRPSIEWSDRVLGAHYTNRSIMEKIFPLAAPHPLEHPHPQEEPTSLYALSTDGAQSAAATHQPVKQDELQHITEILAQSTEAEQEDDELSMEATLAVNKLILTCTHLVLLLFWTLAVFFGVVITDGSVLDNAGQQLIASVEVLQSHFSIQGGDGDAHDVDTALEQQQGKEQDQDTLTAFPGGTAPKSSRPCSTKRRPRPSQRHQLHPRRRLSSLFPQIDDSGDFGGTGGGIGVKGRFYNSPFLASSRYSFDNNKDGDYNRLRVVQLGLPRATTLTTTTATDTDHTKTNTRAHTPLLSSLSSSFSSTVGLQDNLSSISTTSSSATLLDWLDATTSSTTNKNTTGQGDVKAAATVWSAPLTSSHNISY